MLGKCERQATQSPRERRLKRKEREEANLSQAAAKKVRIAVVTWKPASVEEVIDEEFATRQI